MYNLQDCYDLVFKEITETGIQPGNIRSIEIKQGEYSFIARCNRTEEKLDSYVLKREFRIEVSERFLQDDIPFKTVKDILAHEILHTCKDCFDHGKQWKEKAEILKEKKGYHVERTSKNMDLGNYKPRYKYSVRCRNCGNVYYRRIQSDIIKNPQKYQCDVCKMDNTLERCQVTEKPITKKSPKQDPYHFVLDDELRKMLDFN